MKTFLLIAILIMPLLAVMFDMTFIACAAIIVALTGIFLFTIRKELKQFVSSNKEEP